MDDNKKMPEESLAKSTDEIDAPSEQGEGTTAGSSGSDVSASEESYNDTVSESEVEDTAGRERMTMVYHSAENLWTYGSPIIIKQYELYRDNVLNECRFVMEFTNIYAEKLKEMSIRLVAKDDDDNTEVREYTYTSLSVKYLQSAGDRQRIHILNPNAKRVAITVMSISFADGSVWQKEGGVFEPVENIEDLEAFAAEKYEEYEKRYQNASDLVSRDDSESIRKGLAEMRDFRWYKSGDRKLREGEEKLELAIKNETRRSDFEKRKQDRARVMKKRYVKAAVCVAVIAVLAIVLVLVYFIPKSKYDAASAVLENDKYKKAASQFEEIEWFPGAGAKLAEAYYCMGLSALYDGDEDTAKDYFKQAYESSEDSDYGVMAGAFLDYYTGMQYIEEERYDEALELLESSANMATDFNLINKASAAVAQLNYQSGHLKTAWVTIKNVFLKDESYADAYGEYGYAYAKYLVDDGRVKKGLSIYDEVADYTDGSDLSTSVFKQARTMAQEGDTLEAMKLLKKVKDSNAKAQKLYYKIKNFRYRMRYWLGTWRHKGTVNGETVVYKIKISDVLYEGKMCLRIQDQNNDTLGFDTVISDKNHVTQIITRTYLLHFKLKKYSDQKFTYTLKGGNKFRRELKYAGNTYTTTYRKKK